MTLLVCCSGLLGEVCLRHLADLPGHCVVAVLTDRRSTAVRAFAREREIACFAGNPRRSDFAPPISPVDLLVSANYIFILPESIVRLARVLAINIHGSLLPRYMGRTPNTWTIINDECETGITVHEIVAEVDAGDILYQERIAISNVDTGGALQARMVARYPSILAKVVADIAAGRVERRPQDLSRRIYCGKREPSDGRVDWRWSSRKVYNWVRAQTRPYPGAFFQHGGRRYVLWWVEDCCDQVDAAAAEVGVPFERDGKLFVRCGVGAVQLVDYEVHESDEE